MNIWTDFDTGMDSFIDACMDTGMDSLVWIQVWIWNKEAPKCEPSDS